MSPPSTSSTSSTRSAAGPPGRGDAVTLGTRAKHLMARPRVRVPLAIVLLALVATPIALSDPSPVADLRGRGNLGMADFTTAVETADHDVVTLFASQAGLRHAEQVSLVVVPGVPRPLSAGETRALQDHLDRGASLWVLDETGNADPLTAPAGIRVRAEDLLDPSSPFGDPIFAVAETLRPGPNGTATRTELILTAATLLEVNQSQAQVLAATLPRVVRDVDRSGRVEAGDPGGAHPVVATAILGKADGRLVVASDTGLFTNTVMRAAGYGNDDLLDDLLAGIDDGTVVLDASRHEPARAMVPLQWSTATMLAVATDPLAVALLALAALALIGFLVTGAPKRADWGLHEHTLGEPRPVAPEHQHDRLRRLVVGALHDRTGRDASELLSLDDDELDALARQELGGGQYLSGRREIGTRFRSLLQLYQSGGLDT